MFINPQTAKSEGWITGIRDPEKQVQPNAIDFTLDLAFSIAVSNAFVISESGKVMRGGAPYAPVEDRSSGMEFWNFKENTMWDCLSDMYVTLPDGVACMLVARSTFTRNGLFLTSGLYDSGFEGHIGFVLHNPAGLAKVGVGTRCGQIIFVESKNAGQYAGGYNHEEGTVAHQEPVDRMGGVLHGGKE